MVQLTMMFDVRPRGNPATYPLDVSVVVCTCNRAEMFRRCPSSLICRQTDDVFSYEVLVVDNGSTDDTREVVEQVTAESSVEVRYVLESTKGVAYARNWGLAEARAVTP